MRERLRRGVSSRRDRAGLGVTVLLVLGALVVAVPAAMASLPVAVLCVGAVTTAVIALTRGLGHTGSGFLVLGFATVPLNDVSVAGTVELSDAFFGIGFLLLVPRLFGRTQHLPLPFLFGGAGLVGVASLSAMLGDQPVSDFSYVLLLIVAVVVFPTLLVWWQPDRRATIAAASAYVLGNVINVVNSLLDGGPSGLRSIGLTSHPNVMGLCALLGLALTPFLLKALPRKHAWLVALGALVCAYGIWASGSRAALAVAGALTVLYPVLKRSIPAGLGVAALSLPAIIVLDRESRDPDPTNALGRLLGGGGSAGSDDAREAGFRDGLDQFLSHPLLGDGWGTVWGVHNSYLQVAAGVGLFGLLFYLMMLVPILRPLLTVPSPYGLLALPALATVMISVVDPALGSRYIWAVLALALAAQRLAATAPAASSDWARAIARPARR